MFHRKQEVEADVQRGHRLMDSVDDMARNESKKSGAKSDGFARVVTSGLFGQGQRDYPPTGHGYPKD